jgi:hypothetical protein
MDNNTKIKKIKSQTTNYLRNISVEILILLFIVYSLLINISKFSTFKTPLQLTNKQCVFLYGTLSIFSVILLIYCKHLTILNISDIKSNLIPVFLIFIPFIAALIIIYLTTNTYIQKYEIGYEVINEDDNTLVVNDFATTVNNFKYIPPPKIIPSKNARVIIHIIIFGLIIYQLVMYKKYFNINQSRTILDKVLSSNENSRQGKTFIYSLILLLIVLNMLVIYQNYSYASCKLGLPNSWDI